MGPRGDCQTSQGENWHICPQRKHKLKYYLLKIKIVTFSQIELDKKLGCIWHAIVGEEFGYEITYEVGIVILVESFFIITDIIGLYDLCVLRKFSNSSVEVWNSADVRD